MKLLSLVAALAAWGVIYIALLTLGVDDMMPFPIWLVFCLCIGLCLGLFVPRILR